jgi:hypothetical protein
MFIVKNREGQFLLCYTELNAVFKKINGRRGERSLPIP